MRPDELQVITRAGDAPPAFPFRKPFDLSPIQVALAVSTIGCMLSVEAVLPLSNEPFEPDTDVSPLFLARMAVLFVGFMLTFVHPCDRSLPSWAWAAVRHFYRGLPAVVQMDDGRGPSYFAADAEQMTAMQLEGSANIFVVEPPLWGLIRRIPWAASFATSYRAKHVPYRLILPVEAQGSIELKTDEDRAAAWHALWAGLKAVQFPIQIVVQTRPEDVRWLVQCATPPANSPFALMRKPIAQWAIDKALVLTQKRVVVTCSAPSVAELLEHVRDVSNALSEAGLTVRQAHLEEQREIFDLIYGQKRFYPHAADSFGIDKVDWVTIVVRRFPRHCVVGWLNFVTARLPVDLGLFAEPDNGAWVQRIMEWFQGMCMLDTADTAHRDAADDLEKLEGKLKRNEDQVMRTTLLLTMPRAAVAQVKNRLRKAGAEFHEARFEHQLGRIATLPHGGLPRVGTTRPLDGESVAGAFPFGADGLRMGGVLIGTARTGHEAVTLDLLSGALKAAMVVILGTTGAGKTFLMQLLLLRSGLPFVVIDMKPHLDERRHGDFYPLVKAAGGNYHVCKAGEPLPKPHPFAQCYNLAAVPDKDKPAVLLAIAEQEWARAVDSLEDRILAVDEVNWLGKTRAGQEFVERIVSLGRSVGFIGICASQEATDFLSNQRMAKAVTMSSVQFVLAHETGVVDDVVEKLKLGPAAAAELRKFQPSPENAEEEETTRSALLRVGQRLVSLRIEACDEEAALYTTKPAHKRAARAAREEVAA